MAQTAIQVPPLSLIERYGITGPRFTSYPTALVFDESVRERAFLEALARSNDQLIPAPLALYLHIPFCRTLCYYCACHKKVTRSAGVVSDYMTAMHREIAAKSALLDSDRVVEQLHIGGGTPTYLNAGQRSALMSCIDEHFVLDEGPDRDFSIEIDPRTIAADELAGLAELGFNRVSFGVQDLDPDVQRAINRVHAFDDIRDLVVAARAAGFRSVSIDLIYGLPHQTVERFATTVEKILTLMPDALSVFNYAHLPQRFPAQRLLHQSDLPDASNRIRIFRNCVASLQQAGYEYIGMDHFALPDSHLGKAKKTGKLQRCFQGYAGGAGNETLGFGSSAISHIGDDFFQVEKNEKAYAAAIAKNGMAIARGYQCSVDDRRVAEVIQAIMCYARCDKRVWERQFKCNFDDYFSRELGLLAPLITDGLVSVGENAIEVTPMGIVFLRSIAACFDRSSADLSACSRIV